MVREHAPAKLLLVIPDSVCAGTFRLAESFTPG